jgi:hypothetical protein
MTAHEAPGAPGPERYPGETLHLLRSVAADMAQVRQALEYLNEFRPLLENLRQGGLLGLARGGGRRNRPGAG